MRRRLPLVLVAGLVMAAFGWAVPDADGAAAGWSGAATGWGGTSTYDGQEWIHQDFVYDDYGADTCSCGQPNVVSLGGTTGDYRYPDGDQYRDNAADVVEVRVRPLGNRVRVRVLLSTIVDPAVPALYVAHNDRERVVTVLDRDVQVDVAANTVEFELPGGQAETLRLLVGAGLHDGADGLREGTPGNANLQPDEFTTGGQATGGPVAGRLFDLAFNTEELEGRGGPWNEDAQSAALADGDLSDFAVEIDLDALRARKGPAFVLDPGYHVAILTSAQDLGEGMAPSFPQYLGTHQPYAVWVPDGYDPAVPAPFYLSMHSLSSFHNQYRGGDAPTATYATYYEQLGDALGAVVATPLGRGPDGWYEAEALIDTLEVWADVLDRFAIDRDRVYAGGYSMGGYGTYRLTTMMPDAFASAAVVVGPPTNGIWAYPLPPETDGREDRPDNTYHQLESTRHVPTAIKHGTTDELVPVSGVIHQAQRYDELGHEYQFNLFPGHDHLSFAFADGWQEEADWLASHPLRRLDPRRVTLDVRPSTWVEGATGREDVITSQLFALAAEVGAELRGGYWISGVHLEDASGDATAEIDLVSSGIATGREVAARSTGTPGMSAIGPYVRNELDLGDVAQPTGDALTGTLRNVRRLVIDVGRAGLSNRPDVSGIESDVAVHITFARDGTRVGEAVVG